ncbi:MAG: hypothetical protein U1F53_10855 [Burkholderiaceae bacterium]
MLHALVRQVAQLDEGAVLRLVGRDLGGLHPAAVDGAEQVVLGTHRGVEARRSRPAVGVAAMLAVAIWMSMVMADSLSSEVFFGGAFVVNAGTGRRGAGMKGQGRVGVARGDAQGGLDDSRTRGHPGRGLRRMAPALRPNAAGGRRTDHIRS